MANPAVRGMEPTPEAALVQRGYNKTGDKTVSYRGRICRQTTFVKNKTSGMLERIGRGAAGVVGSLAATPFVNLSQDFRDATWRPAISGSAKERLYQPTGQSIPKHEDLLGYNRFDRTSLQDHLEKPNIRSQLREVNGHYFLPENRIKGISGFIFVPKGDFSKAKFMKFWTAKNGKTITNSKDQLQAIRSYCAAYDDIEEGRDKALDKHAATLAQKQGITPAAAKESLKARPMTVVIDPHTQVCRMYGKYNPNKVDPDSYRTGTQIKLSDDTKKEIKHIHGKEMEHRQKLGGDKPFKSKLPEPSTQMDID